MRMSLAIEFTTFIINQPAGKVYFHFWQRNLAMWLLKPLSELGSISGSYFNSFYI